MLLADMQGSVRKMLGELSDAASPVQYQLPIGEERVALNAAIGKQVSLQALGVINCVHCGRKTKKSFNQGYCYPCFTKLAQCDSCIMSPEKCHYHLGTCREPAWGEQFCMTDHVVYLANSSGLKVGITRATQIPTRWIDQGASQALPILRVATRQQSGLVEDLLRDRLLALAGEGIAALQAQFGLQAIQPITGVEPLQIRYPVEQYVAKPQSANLDKVPLLEGTLMGIKGQYLLLDTAVINIRKYTAYQLAFSIS